MKKQKQRAATTFTTDQDGRRIAHVALSGTDERTKLLAEDLERILMDGYSQFWEYTRTSGKHWYVQVRVYNTKGRPRSITVARPIVGAVRGQCVGYADGDHLNLLPENLLMKKGGAWVAVDLLQPRKARSATTLPAETPLKPRAAHGPHNAPQDADGGRKIHRKLPQGYMTI